MTKENLSLIAVIIDMSGSMGPLTNDTIGGFNKFLEEQKSVPGEAIFTLCTFNTKTNFVNSFVKLGDANSLSKESYVPSGGTALLDAVGTTINLVGKNLESMKEEDRPSKVIFLIMTDGEENASREFSLKSIKDMIEHQKEKYNWEFVFMGANIDAVSTGKSLGISGFNSLTYISDSSGTEAIYNSISGGLRSYRRRSSSDVKNFEFFSDENQKPVTDTTLDNSKVDPENKGS